jgi:hypothetical protein
MKLPMYTSQVAPTDAAPGTAFRVRRNANLEAQTKLSQGAPLSQALAEVNNITAVRINMARENLLNEAQLGLENELDNAFREFKQYGSPNTKFSGKSFNKILDGENPLWNSRMEEIKGKVKANLGKDKFMNNKFDLFFSQAEQSARLKIRSIVDTKVRAATIAHRNMKLQKAEDEFSLPEEANASVRDFFFDRKMAQLVTDKNKLIRHGFKSDKLSAQETQLVAKTASKLIENISVGDPNVDIASSVIDEIRTVVFASKGENKDVQYKDLDENQKFAVTLLRKLKDQGKVAQILSGALNIAKFAEGETTAEGKLKALEKEKTDLEKAKKIIFKANKKQIEEEAKEKLTSLDLDMDILSGNFDNYTKDLSKMDAAVLDDYLTILDRHLQAIPVYEGTAGVLKTDSAAYKKAVALKEKISDFKIRSANVQNFHSQQSLLAQQQLASKGAGDTALGQQVSQDLQKELKEQNAAFLDNDGLGYFARKRNFIPGRNNYFKNFDPRLLNKEEDFKKWFEDRNILANRVASFHPNGFDPEQPIQYFTKEEIEIFKNYYGVQDNNEKLAILEDFVSSMGDTQLTSVLEQMELNPELVIPARLMEQAEDNPGDGKSVVAKQTAATILLGSDMIEKQGFDVKNLSWWDQQSAQRTLFELQSVFTDDAAQMVVEWNKAVIPYILGKFYKAEGVGTLTKDAYDSTEKAQITRNATIFGFNQIFNADNLLELTSIGALNDAEMIPFASRGGYQALNENFRVYVPAGISAVNIQNNLEEATEDLFNKSFTLAPGVSEENYKKLKMNSGYTISEGLINDIQRQPVQYGFLANSANQHQLVYLYEDSAFPRAVLDSNGTPIYVDITKFAEVISVPEKENNNTDTNLNESLDIFDKLSIAPTTAYDF